MTNFLEDRFDSGITKLQKTGHIGRARHLDKLAPLANRLMESTDKDVLYDAYFGADPEFTALHYTELFSKSLLITPCDDVIRYRMATLAVEDDVPPIDLDSLFADRLDKYRLVRQLTKEPLKGVVFLPGSNLLETIIDWPMINRLVQRGVKLKPHPITKDEWLTKLKRSFPTAVLDAGLSGYDLMRRAETVYCTSASELGLLGTLLDKTVRRVDLNCPEITRNIYRQIYLAIEESSLDNKTALMRYLNSRYSGIVWRDDPPEKLTQVLDAIAEQHAVVYPSN